MATQPTTQPGAASDRDWREDAVCRGLDPELFYPVTEAGPGRAQVDQAKQVCRRCPVSPECLAEALSRDEPFGVWGGTSAGERRAIKRRKAGGGRAIRPATAGHRGTTDEPAGGAVRFEFPECPRSASTAEKRRLARRAIERQGQTRAAVAAAFGVTTRTVDRWLTAEHRRGASTARVASA